MIQSQQPPQNEGHDTAKHSQEDRLPDSAFAAVYTIAHTRNGRTTRMKQRKFPLHSAEAVNAAVHDWPNQEKTLPNHVKDAAHEKIVTMAKQHKIALD